MNVTLVAEEPAARCRCWGQGGEGGLRPVAEVIEEREQGSDALSTSNVVSACRAKTANRGRCLSDEDAGLAIQVLRLLLERARHAVKQPLNFRAPRLLEADPRKIDGVLRELDDVCSIG